jgi:hypothetical protein
VVVLPAPFGAEEAGHRPLVDLEVELVDGEHLAEALAEPLHADRRMARLLPATG